jgi:hypothetical protein
LATSRFASNQRHEHRPERGVRNVAQRARHLQAPFGALLARIGRESLQRLFGDRDVLGRCAARERRGGDNRERGIVLRDERPHHVHRGLAAQHGDRRHRGDAHRAIRILQRALDARQPAIGQRRPGGFGHPQGPRPNRRRFMRQQQRRHQAPLVHRFEQIHRVKHAPRLGMGELADQRFDRRGIGIVEAQRRRLDDLLLDAAAERSQVLAARRHRRDHPQPHHRQTGVTELLPVETESPVFDQDQDQQRPHTLRKAIHRHVDERFGAIFQLGERQERTSREVLSTVALADDSQTRAPTGG